MQRVESGETPGGSGRFNLSANASSRVWDLCGHTCSSDEVRWQFDRNPADTGGYCAPACCDGCSREGSRWRGDLFVTSTFIVALDHRGDAIRNQSANS